MRLELKGQRGSRGKSGWRACTRNCASGCNALVLLLSVALGSLACGGREPQSAASVAADSKPTDVYVETTADTNDGNVLHMMVRSVPHEIASTTTESYEEALALLADRRDASIVAAQPIFPGKPRRIRLNQPVKESVVLYFFFTAPGKIWRVQMSDPVPREVKVTLGLNQVEKVSP